MNRFRVKKILPFFDWLFKNIIPLYTITLLWESVPNCIFIGLNSFYPPTLLPIVIYNISFLLNPKNMQSFCYISAFHVIYFLMWCNSGLRHNPQPAHAHLIKSFLSATLQCSLNYFTKFQLLTVNIRYSEVI